MIVRRILGVTIGGMLAFSLGMVAAGAISTRQTPDDVQEEPIPTGPIVEIASGEAGSNRWTVVAYESDVGLCVDLELSGQISQSGGGCGFEVGPTQASYVIDEFKLIDTCFIYGPVDHNVDLVRVSFDNATAIDIPTTATAAFAGVRFFADALPQAPRTVESMTAAGSVLALTGVDGVQRLETEGC